MTTGYDATAWSDLFLTVGGAAAALAGLIFVAVSLNHDAVLAHPRLPALAARSIATLVAELFMACAVLAPQLVEAAGIEITTVGVVLSADLLASSARGFDDTSATWWRVQLFALTALSCLPMAAAGISLVSRAGGGFYWAFAESVLGPRRLPKRSPFGLPCTSETPEHRSILAAQRAGAPTIQQIGPLMRWHVVWRPSPEPPT